MGKSVGNPRDFPRIPWDKCCDASSFSSSLPMSAEFDTVDDKVNQLHMLQQFEDMNSKYL